MTDTISMLGFGPCLSMYCVRKVTIESKSFSYLSGCAFTTAVTVDHLSHLMPFSMYQTFDSETRP